MPFSTAGMYSFGTAPPTTLFSNTTPLVPLQRLEDDLHLGVLARAAGLLLVRVGLGVRPRDGFAIGHLRRADIRLDAVFAPQPVDDDLQVQLAHAGEDGLPGLLVGLAAAARGPRRPASAGRSSSSRPSSLVRGSTEMSITGTGKAMRSSTTGSSVRPACRRCRCPSGRRRRRCRRRNFLDLGALVGVHLEHAPDALAVLLGGVQHGVAGASACRHRSARRSACRICR